MNGQWHYTQNGVQAGPISESELNQMASSGQLAPVDMVWKTGMANWVQVGSIQGLILDQSSRPEPPFKKYKTWICFAIIFLILCIIGWYSTKAIEARNEATVKHVIENLNGSNVKLDRPSNEKVLGKWRSGKTTVEFTQSEMIMGENGINLSMGTYKFTNPDEIELTLSELAKKIYRSGHETKESFRKADAAIQQEKYIPRQYIVVNSVVIKVNRSGDDLIFSMHGEPDMMMKRVD